MFNLQVVRASTKTIPMIEPIDHHFSIEPDHLWQSLCHENAKARQLQDADLQAVTNRFENHPGFTRPEPNANPAGSTHQLPV
jgi:hypothetical protein